MNQEESAPRENVKIDQQSVKSMDFAPQHTVLSEGWRTVRLVHGPGAMEPWTVNAIIFVLPLAGAR